MYSNYFKSLNNLCVLHEYGSNKEIEINILMQENNNIEKSYCNICEQMILKKSKINYDKII